MEAIPAGENDNLTFRELEALACSRLTVLLAFLHARIASQKSCLLQNRAQLRVALAQGSRNSMLGCTGLPTHTAAADGDHDIELRGRLRCDQRLFNQHAVGFIEEICFKCSVVDGEITRSGSEEYACRGCLSAAC